MRHASLPLRALPSRQTSSRRGPASGAASPRAPRNTLASVANAGGPDIGEVLQAVARALTTATAAGTPRNSVVGSPLQLQTSAVHSLRSSSQLLPEWRKTATVANVSPGTERASSASDAPQPAGRAPRPTAEESEASNTMQASLDAADVAAALLYLADLTPANTRHGSVQVRLKLQVGRIAMHG
jgi:hypothetical protein